MDTQNLRSEPVLGVYIVVFGILDVPFKVFTETFR